MNEEVGHIKYNDKGQLIIKQKSGRWVIYWNGTMLYYLRKYFPECSNQEVAELCGVSIQNVRDKAKELGLQKSDRYIEELIAEKNERFKYSKLKTRKKKKNEKD